MDDCLIACKSKEIMTAFQKEILARLIGTGNDEGEVTEYLGCELIRHRSAKTAKLVQRGYTERLDCGTASHVLLHWMLTAGFLRRISEASDSET